MSDSEKQKPAQKFFTPLEKAFQEDASAAYARAQRIDDAQIGEETAGGDRKLPLNQQHNFSGHDNNANWFQPKKNFDKKIYYMPEEYNALRREMHEHWPTLFNTVDPATGVSLAYCMVFDAPQFISQMNGALDLVVQYDTDNVASICLQFLNELRRLRGVRQFPNIT